MGRVLPLLAAVAACGGARPLWPGDMPGPLPGAGPPRPRRLRPLLSYKAA